MVWHDMASIRQIDQTITVSRGYRSVISELRVQKKGDYAGIFQSSAAGEIT
jgi:hypothetical protein